MQAFRNTSSQIDMMEFVTKFGPVQTITWPMDHVTKNHKNYLFAKYEDRHAAFTAIQQSGQYKVRK